MMRGSMRAALAGGTAVLIALAAAPGAAWAFSANFDLPAQSALTAIPEFARQAGVQIIAPADELKRVRTPALKGSMDVHTALARLIANTGLEVAAVDRGAITLRVARRPALPPPAPAPVSVATAPTGLSRPAV